MTSQYCTLYLVRHGQTQWNIEAKIQGQLDIPLTKEGEEQAHKQRENLKPISFSRVYSSDLIRAKRTADILNIERQLAVQTSQCLRERNFGSYQGKTMEEGKRKLWELLVHYSDHPHIKESGVETNEKMVGRVITFLREISVAHPGETILVVSHGGVMRVLLLHLGYIAEEKLPSGSIQNLAYIQLKCDGIDFSVITTSGINPI